MSLEAVRYLHDIARRCRAGQPLEDDAARWLGGILEDFLARRADSLEDAMGLAQDRGGVPWWLELAIRQRDTALRVLARKFFSNVSVQVQAKTIWTLAVRYACSSWQADKILSAIPHRYVGTPREWLWQAFRSGARMPIGERQLRSILRPMPNLRDSSSMGTKQ